MIFIQGETMADEAIWTGAISFGLVNIPVRLFNATKERRLGFNFLHKKDLSQVKNLRVSEKTGEVVPYKNIVKGYEYEKGQFIILTDEDFEKANVRKTKTIEIIDFVNKDDVDIKYFERPFYLEPDKEGDEGYVLLREALEKTNKFAVAKFVLKTLEHLVIIKTEGSILLLDQIRFDQEIQTVPHIRAPKKEKITNEELDLAVKFIDKLSTSFDPRKYRDTYTEELKHIIEEKAEGKEQKHEDEAPEATPPDKITEKLKQSLSQFSQREPFFR